ncbi:hypothetical protein FVEG_15663 [Fusarium verticillioides 7600]|uniref:Uncharacterized protein n=1 Tax=Gibberella moniliformis (strain M3125 / FGSC 7600) TaxID=334819 RepID=W7LYU1_GIBM7|nr:hypothetical protein FVEG_15663 [Fusarium verticillioides 7600]EWG44468.1 hypothetical protein FVEG_15663 [Fusarium verticillioides 7600]
MSPPTFDGDAMRCAETMVCDVEEPMHIFMDKVTSKTMDTVRPRQSTKAVHRGKNQFRSRMILSTSPPEVRVMQASAFRSINSK